MRRLVIDALAVLILAAIIFVRVVGPLAVLSDHLGWGVWLLAAIMVLWLLFAVGAWRLFLRLSRRAGDK